MRLRPALKLQNCPLSSRLNTKYPSHLQHCIAKWVRCETYDGTLTSYYGGLTECIVALASRGFDSADNGQPVSRARACTFTWRVFFGVVQQAFSDTDFTGLPAEAADFMAIWRKGGPELI